MSFTKGKFPKVDAQPKAINPESEMKNIATSGNTPALASRYYGYSSYQNEENAYNETDEGSVWQQNGLDGECMKIAEDIETGVGKAGDADQSLPKADDNYYKPDQTITEFQAGWNVTNAIQGMFLVSFPYAVHQGGYWAIFSMIAVAYICCYTGKILVDCLYDEAEDGKLIRIRNSYVEIAEQAWGKRVGARLVNAAQIIELLMTCILYILLCGELLEGTFPNTDLDLTSWIIIASLFIYPCAFLRTLRHVSWLSFYNFIAHMVINAMIIIYCLTKIPDWHWGDVQIEIDIWTFPISLGMIVFSYTSQIFLPTLEGNMIEPKKFPKMMQWTHVGAALFKVLFGYIGFLTWGLSTAEVITNNLPTPAFKAAVNLILVAKALLSYPLPYYAAVEILEHTLFRGQEKTKFSTCWERDGSLRVWALALRLCLCVFTVLMAVFIPHFAILMGFIGSFTGTMLSLIWPCYFHLRLKPKLSATTKAKNFFIILLGLLCTVIGMYYTGHALARAAQGLMPDPYDVGSNIKCQFLRCKDNVFGNTTDEIMAETIIKTMNMTVNS